MKAGDRKTHARAAHEERLPDEDERVPQESGQDVPSMTRVVQVANRAESRHLNSDACPLLDGSGHVAKQREKRVVIDLNSDVNK